MASFLGVCGGISRIVLVVFNAAGLIFGLFLIGLASDLHVSPDDNDLGNNYERTEKDLLVSIVSRYTPVINTGPISAWHIRDADIFSTFFMAMWIGGGLMLIISMIGLIMGAKKSSGGLLLYGGFMVILLLIELIFYGMLTDSSLGDTMNDKIPLKTSIQASMYSSFKNYGGVYETDDNSIGWSFLMLKYDCCGVYGWTEYKTLTDNLNKPIRVAGNIICCDMDLLKLHLNGSCWPGNVQSSEKSNCYDAIVDAILSSSSGQILPVIYIIQCLLIIGAVMILLENKYSSITVEPEEEDYPEKRNTLRPLSEKRIPE
ncbi:uncharacterized protein [Argopecten irradians]|uniref:uncharacterized protein n=1 Tax=Argopecten irradians TaxID=31199 RepID=UPI003723BB3D